nr:MAG TPA: hypothetical protein [Caudoviricetes sp.]
MKQRTPRRATEAKRICKKILELTQDIIRSIINSEEL